MSWDKGVELKFADGKFLFETAPGYKDFEFKVLIDDKQWSNGENFKVQAGKTISITPNF